MQLSLGVCGPEGFQYLYSQFPLWDFFECNILAARASQSSSYTLLSIPFVGFLRMQHVPVALHHSSTSVHSQFPLWDFFECNKNTANSNGSSDLISQFPLWDFFECNCYSSHPPPHRNDKSSDLISQFPLWDFFECNCVFTPDIYVNVVIKLSIPFVGFLRMQPSLIRLSFRELGG